jgi:integrase
MQLPDGWQRCHDFFLQQIYERSESLESLVTYRSLLARFLSDPTKSPADYTHTDALEFIQAPSSSRRNFGRPVSASTHNQRLCVLRSFYLFASTFEVDGIPLYQKALPTTGIRYVKRAFNPHYLTIEELERFFSVIPHTPKGDRDRVMYFLYFWLGRRRAELARLQWKDIHTATVVDADGARRLVHVYSYRSKGAGRQVKTKEIPPAAWNALSSYLTSSRRLPTMKPESYLFISIHPGNGRRGGAAVSQNVPLHPDYINNEFVRYCKLAGLPPGLTLHSLRHTASRLRYESGSDLRTIQQFLDHSSIATTDGYIRTMVGVSDPGARLLEARFGHLVAPD